MTHTPTSAGAALRQLVKQDPPLPIVGAINAYSAMLARRAGFKALYLSGAGVANASRGLPDLGFITLDDVLTDARRITAAVPGTPLLVDADTGWGDLSTLAHGIAQLGQAGVAGVHLEDQIDQKRCGHRPGKRLCSPEDMIDRVKAAVDARVDAGFVVMARTDAAAVEGLAMAIERACRYVEAGADMVFAEALTSVEEFGLFTRAVGVPVLANITEFGNTPLLTRDALRDAGVAMALYPLSAFRAMSAAAVRVYEAIARDGTQEAVVGTMQTRAELYEALDYHAYEKRLDEQLDEESR